MTVPEEEAPANYVPAAAVIRRGQALSGIIGRKECVGSQLTWYDREGRLNTITMSSNNFSEAKYGGRMTMLMPGLTARLR